METMTIPLLAAEISSLIMENQALHDEMIANENRVTTLQRKLRSIEDELAAIYAETAHRILDLHHPSGGDIAALEAATNLHPLNAHHIARLKTLAREFLYITI
jgi:hypothetical protein